MDAKQIDWVQILREINKTMSYESIGFELDMSASNLQKTLLKGSEPRYSVGITLLDLYELKCGKKETPMKNN